MNGRAGRSTRRRSQSRDVSQTVPTRARGVSGRPKPPGPSAQPLSSKSGDDHSPVGRAVV